MLISISKFTVRKPAERIKQTREIAKKIDQKKSTQQAIADKKFEMQMQKLLDSLWDNYEIEYKNSCTIHGA